MVKVPEVYFLNRDIAVLRRHEAWLSTRIETRELNAPGAHYDREHRRVLHRLLSQIDEHGQTCEGRPEGPGAFDPEPLRKRGWTVAYLGHARAKPWTATKPSQWPEGMRAMGMPVAQRLEAATFAELEHLVAVDEGLDTLS